MADDTNASIQAQTPKAEGVCDVFVRGGCERVWGVIAIPK